MRVLHRDPKTGEIKVRVENADDLWHLHNLLLLGDLVRASTYRREEVKTDKVRPERGEKVRVTLTIRVESVEFQAFSDRLRITGVPGRSYTIERAPAVTGPWTSINTQTAPASGLLEYLDTNPPIGSAFYRTVQP